MNIQVREGNYEGNPVLEFWDMDSPAPRGYDHKIPMFTFGVKKARMILGNLEAIKEFAECYKDKP